MLELPLLIFVLGAIVGSFINVLIYRIPRGEDFIIEPSHCMHCGRKLAWYELVPILSYIFLLGRCRTCKKHISWQYPAVEIYSGIIFLLSFILFGNMPAGEWIFIVFLAEIFLIIFSIDLRHMIIPDSIIFATFIGTVIYGAINLWTFSTQQVKFQVFSFDHVFSALGFFGVLFIIWFLSDGKWIGLGDAKLWAVMGLVFGFMPSLNIMYMAIMIGALVGAIILLTRIGNLKTKVPFGSFLCISATFYLFTGFDIISKIVVR